MKTIWKYELEHKNIQTLNIPIGSKVLSVQRQDAFGKTCIWVLVDTDAEKENKIFEIVGTGHAIKEEEGIEKKYVGTYQLDNGYLVFHLFEHIKC